MDIFIDPKLPNSLKGGPICTYMLHNVENNSIIADDAYNIPDFSNGLSPANGRAPISALFLIQVTPNRGSSPYRSGPVMSGPWNTVSAGASNRCSPTSNLAALVSRTRRSATPTASTASSSSWPWRSIGRCPQACGMPFITRPQQKNPLSSQPKKVARSRTSWFTRGLRRIVKLIRSCSPLPPLWAALLN